MLSDIWGRFRHASDRGFGEEVKLCDSRDKARYHVHIRLDT